MRHEGLSGSDRAVAYRLYPDIPTSNDFEVEDYELGKLDSRVLWGRRRVSPDELNNVLLKLRIGRGDVPDLVVNPLSWTIVSAGLAEAIQRLDDEHQQVLALNVEASDPSDQWKVPPLFVVNSLRTVDAIDFSRSDIVYQRDSGKVMLFKKTCFRPSSFPKEFLFRLKGYQFALYSSKEVVERLALAGRPGVALFPVT